MKLLHSEPSLASFLPAWCVYSAFFNHLTTAHFSFVLPLPPPPSSHPPSLSVSFLQNHFRCQGASASPDLHSVSSSNFQEKGWSLRGCKHFRRVSYVTHSHELVVCDATTFLAVYYICPLRWCAKWGMWSLSELPFEITSTFYSDLLSLWIFYFIQ